jgi:hypothetical protein
MSTDRGSSHQTSAASPAFLNALRVVTAATLLSGIVAVWQYEFQGFGRVITVTSVLVSFFGNISVMQFSKAVPPHWAHSALTVFWLGVIGIAVMWVYVLGVGR